VQYHTYQLKDDRAFRVVIKNLHFSTNLDEIKSDEESKGHVVRNISNIKSRATKTSLNMFYVDIEPNKKNLDIYNVNKILSLPTMKSFNAIAARNSDILNHIVLKRTAV